MIIRYLLHTRSVCVYKILAQTNQTEKWSLFERFRAEYGAIFGPAYGAGMVGLLFSSQLGSGLAAACAACLG